jgi:hypothetical protein
MVRNIISGARKANCIQKKVTHNVKVVLHMPVDILVDIRKNKSGEQMSNYKMVKAEDGIVWVTLQPLMNDVKQALENAKNIKVSDMTVDEKRGVDFTILSMESVYNFLGSLMTEQNLQEMISNATEKQTGSLH